MNDITRILIVEDLASDYDLAQREIRKAVENCIFERAERQRGFLAVLKDFQPDLILSDYKLPNFDGMKALELAQKHSPSTPFIIWSGVISEDAAVECMKKGASNYVFKENLKRLGPAVVHALEERQLKLEHKQAEEVLRDLSRFPEENPNPILRITPGGQILYANSASQPLLDEWKSAVGGTLPTEWKELIADAFEKNDRRIIDAFVPNQIFSIMIVPLQETGYVNLYGRDVTERKQAEIEIQQRNDDLALINALNEVINRGENLDAVVNLMAKEIKRIFSSEYTAIYLLNPDGQSLKMQQYFLPPDMMRKIEKLIGRTIPLIEIPIQEGGFFQSVLLARNGKITSDPKVIQGWIGEFVETSFLPPVTRGAIRKLIPHIYKLLDIKSTILIPLFSDGKALGLLNVSGPNLFTEADLKRIENIGIQLTTAIQRKKVEETLKEERNLLRTLIDNLPDRIYAMDTQGRKTLSNTADWKASGGKTLEDVIGRTDFDTYPPELAEPFWQLDKAVLDSGQPVFNYEEPGLDFEGRQVSILTTKIPLRDDAGNVIGLVGVGRDITERKQMDEKLHRSENRYRLATKATNDVIWEWSPETNQLLWSENARHVFGYSDEEVGPDEKWWDNHIHPDDRERVVAKLNALITGNESIWLEEYRFLLKDGSYAYIGDRAYIERDKNGEPIRMIGAMSDITPRKEGEIERQALLEIMQGLANTKDLPELLKLIHQAIDRVIYAKNFFVVLYQRNNGLFEEIYSVDQYDAPEPPSKLEKSITSYVFRSGEPLLLTRALFDTLAAQGEVELVGTNSASWLGVPLKTSGRTIGVMAVQDYENENRYSKHDEDFLASIASQVALAIERKQAEEDIRESEEHYRAIFEGVQDAIFVESVDGKILTVNERACEMFGYSHAEFLTKTVTDLVPQGHPIFLAGGTEFSLSSEPRETVNQRANGEMFPIEISGRVQVINGETILLVVVRDITERKQAEEMLRESEERFSSAFEYASIGIALVKPEGHWFKVNHALCELTGYSEEELLQKTFQDITHPDDLESDLGHVHQLLANELNSYQIEKRYFHKLGHVIWVLLSVSLVRDHGGKPIYLISQIQDITERRRAEEALHKSEALYRQAIEVAGAVPYYESYYDEGRSIKYEFIGEGIRQITGYGPEEFSATLWDSLVEEINLVEDLAGYSLDEGIQRVRTGENSTWKCEHRIRARDGKIHWVFEAAVELRDEYGISQGSIGTYQDITERKRAEDAEREQRALAEALRETAETLNSTLDYGEVLDRILAAAGRVVPHNAATIMLIDGESAHVVRLHGYDKRSFHDEIMRIRLPLAETNNLRQMLETGKTVIVHDTHSYMGWKRLTTTDWLRSNVGAPISISGEVIGFILLDSEKVGFFTPVHAERLEAFANQAALAIHNARLLQQAQEEIVERKRAEVELRTSDERFRQLANNIEEVFWMTDAVTGREIYLSPAAEKIWGRPIDFLLYEPNAFISAVYAEDQPAVLRALEREKAGEKVELEYRVVTPDGSLRWIWNRAFPVFDETGTVKTVAGIAADITERKQAENDIRRHLAELEALYENGLAVGQLLEPHQIGQRIIESFARHLSWHHVAIRLLHTGTDELELIAFNQPGLGEEEKHEVERHFNQMVGRIGRGLSGWVFQTGESLRTGDVHSHPQYIDTYAGIQSGLYMPLKVGELIIGCIAVESEQADAFSAQDEHLLATLANQAAVALENARLYQTIQLELSERKKAEQALRTSETHYRELADSITDILFELDENIHITHWNKASELLTGLPAASVIGKPLREVLGGSETIAASMNIFENVLTERLPTIFEMNFTPDNRRNTYEINAYPSTRGISVVAKDVTERKLTETLMQKRFELMEYSSRHTLNELMQKALDEVSELTESQIGFLQLFEEDQTTIGMQMWSTNTLQLFNIPVSAGTHLPAGQAGVWADAIRQRRSLIHNDYESLPEKKGLPEGHTRVIREMVIPIIRNEKIVAVLGVGNKLQEYTQKDMETANRFADYAWDITERKRMGSVLADERNQLAQRVEERTADLSRANSNLARALRVKDEFLANMSHELRTPLNAILGLSESLGEQVAGPLNEKQQKYLATINESGHHLLSLINDILDLAKIEAGQITLDINKVDVNSVCQASLRMIKQLAQKKNQEVLFEIDNDLGLMWADERRLKQMIVNLLSNAVKFTPEAGRLGLEVQGDRAGNKVIITVWDNGLGISERDLGRLFKPFVQLDSGLAREATGTGLGLALVAQMARLHGGSISVDSHPGEGSRFNLQLPWEPALAPDAAIRLRSTGKFRAIDPNARNKPTILLIEDTREVVMMLRDYLEMAGYKIVTAQDGLDGLTQAKLTHPDLILMDIQMPRMDGFEATRILRNDPKFRNTPIIALTALAMSNDRQLCLDAGMDEYISKPVNLKELLKILQKFIFENGEATQS